MQLPHSMLVPAKYFTWADSSLRLLYFLSAFQTSLQQQSLVFKLVATKPECVFWSNVPFTCHTTFLLLPAFCFKDGKNAIGFSCRYFRDGHKHPHRSLSIHIEVSCAQRNAIRDVINVSALLPLNRGFLKFSVKPLTHCQRLISKMNQ